MSRKWIGAPQPCGPKALKGSSCMLGILLVFFFLPASHMLLLSASMLFDASCSSLYVFSYPSFFSLYASGTFLFLVCMLVVCFSLLSPCCSFAFSSYLYSAGVAFFLCVSFWYPLLFDCCCVFGLFLFLSECFWNASCSCLYASVMLVFPVCVLLVWLFLLSVCSWYHLRRATCSCVYVSAVILFLTVDPRRSRPAA